MAIQQSTSVTKAYNLGPALTTVTLDGISKNGGAFAAASAGVVTELTGGWYSVTLDGTDTDTVGDLALHFVAVVGTPIDPPAEQVTVEGGLVGASVKAMLESGIVGAVLQSLTVTNGVTVGDGILVNTTTSGKSAFKLAPLDGYGLDVVAADANAVRILNGTGGATTSEVVKIGDGNGNTGLQITGSTKGVELLGGTNTALQLTTTGGIAFKLVGDIGIDNQAGTAASRSYGPAQYAAGTAPLGAPTEGQVAYIIPFFLYNTSTGAAITGATPTATVSLDGAAFGAVAGTMAEIGNGCYTFATDTGDLAGEVCVFRFEVASSNNPTVSVRTVPLAS